MSIKVVRLGTPRLPDEGVRIGTVRRPPRGVRKADFARADWFDVWLPNLAPSLDTMKQALRAQTPADWSRFARKYRTEMKQPAASHVIATLAQLSHTANFSVGCYCADENHCHRSLLRQLLREQGADID
jgi:uncharacterized protein YeaO (DUF488 family)